MSENLRRKWHRTRILVIYDKKKGFSNESAFISMGIRIFFCAQTVIAWRLIWGYTSLVVRKPAFGICEKKAADQLRGNREADQHLCFCYTASMIPLLSKSKISRL